MNIVLKHLKQASTYFMLGWFISEKYPNNQNDQINLVESHNIYNNNSTAEL